MIDVHPTIQVTWEFDLETDEELQGYLEHSETVQNAVTDHEREMLTNIELSNHFGVPVIIDLNDFFLPTTELDDDMITDSLSDEYGWLVKSFSEV